MTDEKMLELAKEAGAWTPMGLPTDWNAGDVVFSSNELRKFAALVRRETFKQVDDLLRATWFATQEEAQEAIRALAASPFPKSGG